MAAAKPLARVVAVMDVISTHPSGATVMEVAERLDLPKTTAYRIMRALVDVSYLTGGGRHGRYRLGPRFVRQYQNSVSTRHIVNLVQPTLRHLSGLLDEVVYLNVLVLDEVRAVCAEFPPAHTARTMVMPGDLFPVYATASGKVLCAYQEPELRQKMIDGVKFIPYRPNTIRSKADLERELVQVAEQSYGISDDEIDEDVYAISVPVKTEKGDVLYSLGVNGIKDRILGKRNLKEIVKILTANAAEISLLLRDLY